jgi:hypothetical protein
MTMRGRQASVGLLDNDVLSFYHPGLIENCIEFVRNYRD